MGTQKLTVISANISRKNPLGSRALFVLHKKRPDILCLQEILQSRIDRLKQLGYQAGKAQDYQHIGNLTGYIATGVKEKSSVISMETVKYSEKKMTSWWSRVMQFRFSKVQEHHKSVLTTFRFQGKIFRVLNAHLSMACGPRERVAQLETLLRRYADGRTIFCGDFNIVNDELFRLFVGWACGYRFSDYFYDERAEANRLIKEYKLQNPFAKRKTTSFPFHQQWDHILVPNCFGIAKKKMLRIPLSDHKALMVDLVLEENI